MFVLYTIDKFCQGRIEGQKAHTDPAKKHPRMKLWEGQIREKIHLKIPLENGKQGRYPQGKEEKAGYTVSFAENKTGIGGPLCGTVSSAFHGDGGSGRLF